MSIIVYKRVGGFHKGSRKKLGYYRRYSKNRGLRFRGKLRVRVSV